HDRRGTVHYDSADRDGDGWATGDAGMGAGRGARHLRRAGLGGVRRGDARIGRLLPLLERNLRAAEGGTVGVVSFYLATLVQRPAFDCFGSGGALAICGFLLAGSGADMVNPNLGREFSGAGLDATDMGRDAGDSRGNRRLPAYGVFALPADHGDLTAFDAALGGRDGDDRMDHLRGPVPFQRASGIRFASGRVFVFAQLFSRTGRRDADRRLRHWGVLQRLLSRR